MKISWILLLAVIGFTSCNNRREKYDVLYEVQTTNYDYVESLTYRDEDGTLITLDGPNVTSTFSRKFTKRKGFNSYLQVKGYSGNGGQIQFLHRVVSKKGTNSYEMNKSFSGGSQIKLESEYTLD